MVVKISNSLQEKNDSVEFDFDASKKDDVAVFEKFANLLLGNYYVWQIREPSGEEIQKDILNKLKYCSVSTC